MDEHHLYIVLLSPAGHLSGLAHCCNRSLLLVEVKPAPVLLQWSVECLYLQTEPNLNVIFTLLHFTSPVLHNYTATLKQLRSNKNDHCSTKWEREREREPTWGRCDRCDWRGDDAVGIERCHLLHLHGCDCCHGWQVRWLGDQRLLLDKLRFGDGRRADKRGRKGIEKTKRRFSGRGYEKKEGRDGRWSDGGTDE